MASDRWEWDPSARRYRDLTSGRFLSARTVRSLRDQFATAEARWAEILVDSLVDGTMTVQAWEREMRARIRRVYVGEYLLGRGGRNVMSPADRGILGRLLRTQYEFLRSFAEDVAAGSLSPAQARARAALYFGSSTQAHERGKSSAYSPDLRLPAFPGDGGTECVGSCRCSWRIVEKSDRWEATWQVNSTSETCSGCRSRAETWSPYVQLK